MFKIKKGFVYTYCTCGLCINFGEVLVALQFDFIKDVHLLLCREWTIEPHLWSTAKNIKSLILVLYVQKTPLPENWLTHHFRAVPHVCCCWSGCHMESCDNIDSGWNHMFHSSVEQTVLPLNLLAFCLSTLSFSCNIQGTAMSAIMVRLPYSDVCATILCAAMQ